MSIKSVMPSNHLILFCPLLLPPSVFPSIRGFSNESLHIRWPKYWSFSFSISPSSEYSGLISFRMDWLDLLAVQGTLKSLLHLDNKTYTGPAAGSELEPGVGRVQRARLSRLRRDGMWTPATALASALEEPATPASLGTLFRPWFRVCVLPAAHAHCVSPPHPPRTARASAAASLLSHLACL